MLFDRFDPFFFLYEIGVNNNKKKNSIKTNNKKKFSEKQWPLPSTTFHQEHAVA